MNLQNTERPTALITGASRGIGSSIAKAFAKEGYELYLTCSKTVEELNALARVLTDRYGVPCHAFQADAGNPGDMDRVFSQIPRLDVLVNNAGMAHMGLLSDMSVEQWRRVLSVNLDSCFYTSRRAIPLMLQRHSGKIIQISSVWGNVGASMEVAYSASKGGVNSFTRALAKELAPSNIQVNAIACGLIDTQMNACLSPEELEAVTDEIPADRIGKPEEVATLVLQLAHAPGYLTGQVITMDGGWC